MSGAVLLCVFHSGIQVEAEPLFGLCQPPRRGQKVMAEPRHGSSSLGVEVAQ